MATILKYKFVNGEITEITVEDVYAVFIIADRVHEETRNRKHRDHTASLDTFSYEDRRYFGMEETPETIFIRKEESEPFIQQLNSLTKIQKRRLMMFFDGMSCEEIAKAEQVSASAVSETIRCVRNKLEQFL